MCEGVGEHCSDRSVADPREACGNATKVVISASETSLKFLSYICNDLWTLTESNNTCRTQTHSKLYKTGTLAAG